MSAEIEEIYSILLSRGFQETLFGDLENKKQAGKETVANCPFCGDTKRHFSYSSQKSVYQCWKCGASGDWLNYLQEKKGRDFREALQLLADEAGVRLSGGDSFRANYEARKKKASILEEAQEYFIEALFTQEGRPVLNYLLDGETGRGYLRADIEEMRLGAYLGQDGLLSHLKEKGFSQEEAKEAGLLTCGFGDTHQVAWLWKDISGRAIGLVARSILPAEQLQEKGLPKYLYSKGLKKSSSLIGFEAVRGSKEVILQEAPLDALLLNSKGLKSVATGGASLSAEQIEALEQTGTKEILLAFDNDRPGQEATEKAIQALSVSKLRPYVVSLPEGFKDAGEMLKEQDGLETFKGCLKQAERGSRWLTRMLVRQHDSKTPRGLDMALESALSYIGNLEDGLEKREALEVLQKETGLSDEDLSARREEHLKKASTRKAEQALQETSRRLQEAVSEGNLIEAETVLQDGLEGFRQSRGVETPERYSVERLLKDIRETSEGLKTGWSGLDDKLSIPLGGISVIAGRPGHGKTAFMLNLLLQCVKKYPEKAFYFFSYEEAPSRLAVKLLMMMAGKVLHPATNRGAYINRLKEMNGQEPEISKALSDFGEMAESGRLNLVEFVGKPIESLAPLISHLAERQEIGGIFVDYIQKVGVRRPTSPDYLNIKRVSQGLLEQAVSTNLPLIVGAQFGRPAEPGGKKKTISLSNLRECGDIEQDANLVLGLWNEGKESQETKAEPLSRLEQKAGLSKELEVHCLKYRDGEPGWSHILQFEGAIQKVSEEAIEGEAPPW